jgi:hypothetical protein
MVFSVAENILFCDPDDQVDLDDHFKKISQQLK